MDVARLRSPFDMPDVLTVSIRDFVLRKRMRPNSATAAGASEAESCSSVPEQRARRRPIEAQSAAIARAMASICNDEREIGRAHV